MNFYDSIITGGQRWPKRAREELNTAVLEYLMLGTVPELDSMNQYAAGAFEMLLPVLDNQIESARNGKKGAEARKAKRSQATDKPPTEQGTKPPSKPPSKPPTKPPSKAASQPADKPPTEQDTLFRASPQASEQEQEQEEEKPLASASGKKRPPRPRTFSPPTVGDVARVARERNLTLVDPEEFWAHYDAQGWLLGNGNPMVSWESKLISWNSERRQRQQEQGGYDATYD